jgi:asparagine synthase (glutamine-hydrolysing)
MCGIAGFVGTGNVKVLEKMTRTLAHRGPDGEDFRVDAPVYLGHRRLAIIDVEGGRQPMSTRDRRYCIVYNGEIYNFRELRAELERRGHRFSTDHSDTETLLLGFAEAQEKVLDQLNGMWAFVIYDRAEKTLFGARDRFGKKPFYYFHRGTDFAFASELTALLEHPEVSRSVSKLSLQKYFAYGYIPAPRSVIRDVWKLPAGHWFRFDLQTGNLKIQKYWDYQPEPDETKRDPRAIAEELADALEQAVRSRLVSDVPLGAFLSGGIDSSAIATFATRAIPDLKTFTIGFEERTFDESRHAQLVARGLETSHAVQRLSLEKSKDLLPSLVDRLDEPMGDPSLLPTYLLCQFAREHVTVAISGDGGDELFCGYDPFRALRRANVYAKLVPKPLHIGIRLLASRLPRSLGQKPRLIFVGRLNRQRNLDFLPGILSQIADLDWELDIAGEGDEGPALRNAFAPLSSRVLFHGWLGRERTALYDAPRIKSEFRTPGCSDLPSYKVGGSLPRRIALPHRRQKKLGTRNAELRLVRRSLGEVGTPNSFAICANEAQPCASFYVRDCWICGSRGTGGSRSDDRGAGAPWTGRRRPVD